MARQAADYVRGLDRPVASLVVSPLQRTRESAEPFIEAFGLEPVIDERVIEPTNVFEGRRMVRALLNPWNWRHLRRPALPSWGEPYNDVIARMNKAMTEAWENADGGDVVIVSHQLPIWVTHLAVAGLTTRHDPARSSLRALQRHQLRDGGRQVVRGVVRRAGVDRRRRRRGGGVMRGIRPVLAGRPLSSASSAALAACANDPLAEQYRSGDNKGFIAADGFRVVEIPAAERGEPVEFEGTTEAGDEVSSADYAGDVLVVNFWYAACGPCRAEARGPRGGVLGVRGPGRLVPRASTPLDAARGRRRLRRHLRGQLPERHGAHEDGAVKLAFAERTPINATPTTLVLDGEGPRRGAHHRTAADASVLTTLVRDALEEP